ncbi:MAG: Ribonuclease [Patescibacteria group bacterium]|nr:Ribonuclease [Patescibacteria group bacterium]
MTHMPIPSPTWKLIRAHVRAGRTVIGIDEVGRGAWAGPVVAGAVILPPNLRLPGVRDSKLLSPAARERLSRDIRRQALAIGIGWVAPAEVDAHGLSWAVRESGLRALAGLGSSPDTIVILDGRHNYLQDTAHESQAIVKADALIVPVAAASVVAKVARDRYMALLARRAPGYGFELHKGYGTRVHQAALATLGPSPHHRLSFAPLRARA